MTANTEVFTLTRTEQPGNYPGKAPKILFGNGTPAGDVGLFLEAAEGTIYIQVDATDDTSHLWQKVASDGDDNDWYNSLDATGFVIDVIAAAAAIDFSKLAALTDGNILVGNGSNVAVSVNPSGDVDVSNAGVFSIASDVIVNADVKTNAAIVGSKFATNARRHFAVSKEFNIDNGSGTADDDIILVPSDGITIVAVRAIYTVATDTAGVASANFKLGTTVGGAELVAATALEVSKAVGSYTAATLVTGAGAIAANGMIAVRHTGIAATEAGNYKVQIEFTVDD